MLFIHNGRSDKLWQCSSETYVGGLGNVVSMGTNHDAAAAAQ